MADVLPVPVTEEDRDRVFRLSVLQMDAGNAFSRGCLQVEVCLLFIIGRRWFRENHSVRKINGEEAKEAITRNDQDRDTKERQVGEAGKVG